MKQYDVIIIGSGLGSLVCGAVLGKNGYSVCIYEKNRQIGGCMQTYARDKTIIDSGVHYIGSLGEEQALHKIFRYLGIMDAMKLKRLDIDGFDYIHFKDEDKVYKHAQGYDNFIEQLAKEFPKEKDALHAYCEMMKDACSKFPLFNLRTGDFKEKEKILGIDTAGYIRSITDNERLRQVLAGNNLLYAGVENKTPFYVHALVQNSYIESAWRCLDGGSQISRALNRVIREQGGEIIRNAEVKSIVGNDGLVEYIKLADGQEISGKYYISGLHPSQTIAMTESDSLRGAYRSRIAKLENTPGTFMINAVLKPSKFPYLNYNYYHHASDNAWAGADYTADTWPQTFGMFVSAGVGKDQYADNLCLMTYMHYDEVSAWHDTFSTDSFPDTRGDDYQAFKKEKAEKLLEMAEKRFPGLKDSIHAYYVATPLTFRDYLAMPEGSMYGVMKDCNDPLKAFISPSTRLRNLYLTGQNMNLHGILGVTMSSLVTSAELVGMDKLVNDIIEA